ncbi:MAG: 2-C-methyl-D-erythritol 4-phosphate cytidylyltransferase [Alphaproteobacteria bacterium]|nr:2-C-methyl-D-erythritol 4-phosphate cytidylyltransferase [Alphaproteobacteria bacterium]
MPDPMAFHVLIAAAGRGLRVGGGKPKQYINIAGKPVLRHSIETFLRVPGCASVRVIIDAQDADLYHDAVCGLSLPEPVHGGNDRNSSVFNGIKSFLNLNHEDIILVHDAARPCLLVSDVLKLLVALRYHRAATLAAPVNASLRRAEAEEMAGQSVARDALWAVQTPQGFCYGDLLEAHRAALSTGIYTDDTQLVSALGIPVKLVEGSERNLKITRPEDIDLAERILGGSPLFLTGMGFDVHGFSSAKPGPVTLCGVEVPCARALEGHSDADVGLHALTDAILGAIGAGDIGRHFPPTDPAFAGMDSAVFLRHALEQLHKDGGALVNIDLTLICELPKITPYADAMRARLAALTGLKPQRINVKATTTEKLGFTGRGEGIAAQAVVSVSMPMDAHE